MPPVGGPRRQSFLTEEEKKNRPKVTKELLVRIFSYLKPYWKQLLIVLIAIVISSILNLLPSVLTGKIIDEGLIGRSMKKLVLFIVLSLAVTLGANLIGVLESYHLRYSKQNVQAPAKDVTTLFYLK